jgi:hypothetical protein
MPSHVYRVERMRREEQGRQADRKVNLQQEIIRFREDVMREEEIRSRRKAQWEENVKREKIDKEEKWRHVIEKRKIDAEEQRLHEEDERRMMEQRMRLEEEKRMEEKRIHEEMMRQRVAIMETEQRLERLSMEERSMLMQVKTMTGISEPAVLLDALDVLHGLSPDAMALLAGPDMRHLLQRLQHLRELLPEMNNPDVREQGGILAKELLMSHMMNIPELDPVLQMMGVNKMLANFGLSRLPFHHQQQQQQQHPQQHQQQRGGMAPLMVNHPGQGGRPPLLGNQPQRGGIPPLMGNGNRGIPPLLGNQQQQRTGLLGDRPPWSH